MNKLYFLLAMSLFVGTSLASVSLSTPANASIEAPRAFVMEGGGDPYSLHLYWANPNNANLDHVNIYLSRFALTNFGIVATATGTQAQPNQKGEYLLTNLSDQRNTTNYYYAYVTAVDKSGTESSPTITLKRQTGSAVDVSGTDPVAGLTATALSATSIQLSWGNPIQDDLFQTVIYRSTDPMVAKIDANLITRQVVLPNTTGSYTDTSLNPDTKYYYRVVTEDIKGNSSEPVLISGTTQKASVVPPVTPPIITPPSSDTPPAVMPNPRNFDYRAQWVYQSGVLSADKTAHVVYAHAGDVLTFSLTLKNIGTSTWLADTVDNANELKIGTWRLQDRTSQFQSSNWLSTNRVVRLAQNTPTNGTATFTWTMTVPANVQPATYHEYFRPVAEYCKWFGPDGIFWDIIVQ